MNEVERALERSEVVLKEFRERNRRNRDSPQLMLEQERLSRDVQTCPEQIGVNSTVFIELKKQFEVAKIEEIKNIPIMNVLDAARPPVRRSYPLRRSAALTAFILIMVVSVIYVAFGPQGKVVLEKLASAIRSQPLDAADQEMVQANRERDGGSRDQQRSAEAPKMLVCSGEPFKC